VTVLALTQPYSFELSTERFRAFGPDLANLWHRDGLHRVVAGREARIEAAPGGVRVEPLDDVIEPAVSALLGAGFDLEAFASFARQDPVLARLSSALAGFRPPLAPDAFEALVTSISAQQVSLRAAFAIRNRLIAAFGERAEHAYAFPTRERLAHAPVDEVVATGFSWRKAESILALARSNLDLAALREVPDDDVRARLTAFPGIGDWTVDWFLARHLARPHAWPAGDLGLRKAAAWFYAEGRQLSIQEVRSMSERFAPFENLSAHFLLSGLRIAP